MIVFGNRVPVNLCDKHSGAHFDIDWLIHSNVSSSARKESEFRSQPSGNFHGNIDATTRNCHFPKAPNTFSTTFKRFRYVDFSTFTWYTLVCEKEGRFYKKKHSRRHSSLTPFGVLSRSRFLHCIPATFTRAIIWMSRKFNAYYFSIFSQQIQQQKRNNLSIYDIYSENIVSNIHTT